MVVRTAALGRQDLGRRAFITCPFLWRATSSGVRLEIAGSDCELETRAQRTGRVLVKVVRPTAGRERFSFAKLGSVTLIACFVEEVSSCFDGSFRWSRREVPFCAGVVESVPG